MLDVFVVVDTDLNEISMWGRTFRTRSSAKNAWNAWSYDPYELPGQEQVRFNDQTRYVLKTLSLTVDMCK